MEAKLVEVLDALMKAAGQIGMEGVRLWPQMVGITFVRNVSALVGCVALFGASLIAVLRLAPKCWENDNLLPFVGALVAGIVAVIALMVLLIMGGTWLAGAIYPEAQTVLELAAKIK